MQREEFFEKEKFKHSPNIPKTIEIENIKTTNITEMLGFTKTLVYKEYDHKRKSYIGLYQIKFCSSKENTREMKQQVTDQK